MKALIEKQDDVVVIRFSGEFTIQNALEIRLPIEDVMAKGHNKILLRMGEVTYVDSTVLGVLVALHKHAKRNKQQMIIAEINANMHRLLNLTRLNEFFTIFIDSLEKNITDHA